MPEATRRLVALIRGINIGRAKRVAMADLRSMVEDLGFSNVHTVLNSGNVVFTGAATSAGATARIRQALVTRLGIQAGVVVLTAAELETVAAYNPLAGVADNPSRSLVAFLINPADGEALPPLLERDWTPEALALGARVVYLWCPNGIIRSPVAKAVDRVLGDAVTIRNWATVLRIRAVL